MCLAIASAIFRMMLGGENETLIIFTSHLVECCYDVLHGWNCNDQNRFWLRWTLNVKISISRSPPCLWNENRVSWELARWRRRRPSSERSSRLSTKSRSCQRLSTKGRKCQRLSTKNWSCQRLSTNIGEEKTSLKKEPQKHNSAMTGTLKSTIEKSRIADKNISSS